MGFLQADVYVAPETAAAAIVPGTHPFKWSPIACTLIRGEHEAVLIDTPITIDQTKNLADWIEKLLGGRRLTTIYITHGHADHFMGIGMLQERFPGLRAIATVGTVAHMAQQIEPTFFSKFWGAFFPGGQLPKELVLADPLPVSNEFTLEGHMLRAVEVGHTDTTDTTVLHIPDLDMVVCGDVVYGDVHQYLVEANTKAKRQEWIRAIEMVEKLNPKVVVPGHMRLGAVNGVFNLEASKSYIKDFDAFIDEGAKNEKELYDSMMEKYGGRVNAHALEGGCRVAFKAISKM